MSALLVHVAMLAGPPVAAVAPVASSLGGQGGWAGAFDGVPGLGDSAVRLIAAALLGALIGWERGRAEKPADSRTMMLISVGAAGFVLIGARVVADHAGQPGIQTDPTRVLSYIISGVGFLGAGAILHSKKAVRGLTTASSVWCTAAVGAACGLGEFVIGAIISVIVLVTLWTPWLYHEMHGTTPGNGNGNGNGPAVPASKSAAPGGVGVSRKSPERE
jgi:putative Mg2+ transporter-C (MgtC) family protein